MVVALIALAFSMTGTGIAARGLITGKQIKDRSITSDDLAAGAVKTKNLAKNAVTSEKVAPDAIKSAALAPGAVTAGSIASNSVTSATLAPGAVTAGSIAPNSVTSTALAPASVTSQAISKGSVTASAMAYPIICPNGEIITQSHACPLLPPATASADNIDMTKSATLPGVGTCFYEAPLNFETGPGVGSSGNIWTPSHPADFPTLGSSDPMHTVTVNATFAATPGVTTMGFVILKVDASGPQAGQRRPLSNGVLRMPPAAAGDTSTSFSMQLPMAQDDRLELQPISCGANARILSISMTLVPNVR
jgi:hypothetical protein